MPLPSPMALFKGKVLIKGVFFVGRRSKNIGRTTVLRLKPSPEPVTIRTRLTGNFLVRLLEEHRDRKGLPYLIDDRGRFYVPVDLSSGTPVAQMPVPEAFRTEEDPT